MRFILKVLILFLYWGPSDQILFLLHFLAEDGSSTIRPLETLHNALSLRQLDNFLEFVTTANFKTPSHTPPRVGEMPEDSEEGLSLPKLYPKSLAFISPQSSFGWSTSCSQPISGNSPPHLSLGSDLVMMADSNPPSLQLTEVLPMDQILPQQPGQEQMALAGQELLLVSDSHQSGHPMSSQVSPHELLSKVRKLSEEQK
jgi:inositol hexakisphosphate/diphosphoinositol-pentakisphosphate kinase